MQYRPEVDGLRALAVVPVILYHAGLPLFGGGYVGVDIFFVISGYLITRILIDELEKGTFSLVGFYERRARRILPALFLVVGVSTCVAWAVLMPRDMKEYSQSVVAVSTFSSNIFFLLKSGYFDGAAELKPLLHTWSLAVEEQFYILFPPMLYLIWRFGRIAVFTALIGLLGISLILAETGARTTPNAAFYLLHTRAWELLLGALAALGLHRSGWCVPSQVAESLGFLGLALILAPVFVFDTDTQFPGVMALPPTIGTMFILLFATRESMVGRILSMRILVGTGLVSFSAYLWHQPLFAFARHVDLVETGSSAFLLLTLMLMLLSFLSWRYVELPFRNRELISRRSVFLSAGLATVAFVAFGLAGQLSRGFPDRLPAHERAIALFEDYPEERFNRSGRCFLKPNQTAEDFANHCSETGASLIWGDSYAAALYSGLAEFGRVSQFTSSGCPPIVGQDFADRPGCRSINQSILTRVAALAPATIILHANWSRYEPGRLAGLASTVAAIRRKSPRSKIVILGGVPNWKGGLPRQLIAEGARLTHGFQGHRSFSAITAVETSDTLVLSAVAQADDPLTRFVPLTPALCDNESKCVSIVGRINPAPFAWDYGHMTHQGARHVAGIIEAQIARDGLRGARKHFSEHPSIIAEKSTP